MMTSEQRLIALEVAVAMLAHANAELSQQNLRMAEAVANQASMLTSLLLSLNQSAESLPGEKPIINKRHRAAKAN